ncbi:transposase [Ktedonobacter sp. SOSP1-85]|uniref:transposase n=1 Tax=Ktedonobacter sp. SOSP1-85 TaxID=2778367 RepID=UPI0035AFE4B0
MLLTRGRRTITAALRAVGLQEERHFNLFHHVLNRARWSPLRISRLLLLLLVQTFVPKGATVEIVADETLERRWGPHITKCGYYHDPVRSSEKHKRISRGLRWLCLMLIVIPPWASRPWALPFLCVLFDFRGGRYKGRTPTENRSRLDKTTHEACTSMAP